MPISRTSRLDLEERLLPTLPSLLSLLSLPLLLTRKRVRIPKPTPETLLYRLSITLVETRSDRDTCNVDSRVSSV